MKISIQKLSKTDRFDKSEINRTTIKSFFRPLSQYMLAVKKKKSTKPDETF